MADRFWVGGTGNYNDTGHWSASSGGSSGASVPSSSDNVFFNGSSGTGTVTVNVSSSCLNMDWTGAVGLRLTISSTLNVFGDFKLVANNPQILNTVSGTLAFRGSGTITTANNGSGNSQITCNVSVNATGTYTFADPFDMISGLLFSMSNGTLTTNGQALTTDAIQKSGGTLNLGASTVTIRGTSGTVLSNTGGTINAGTSTVNIVPGGGAGGGASTPMLMNLQGASLNNLYFTFTSPGYTSGNFMRVTSSLTCSIMTVEPKVIIEQTSGTTITTGILVARGSSGNTITWRSQTSGSASTISAGTASVDWVAVKDSIASGAGSPFYNPNGTNNGGNTNWQFTTSPATDTSKHRGGVLLLDEF